MGNTALDIQCNAIISGIPNMGLFMRELYEKIQTITKGENDTHKKVDSGWLLRIKTRKEKKNHPNF